jgi:hypothetical protein
LYGGIQSLDGYDLDLDNFMKALGMIIEHLLQTSNRPYMHRNAHGRTWRLSEEEDSTEVKLAAPSDWTDEEDDPVLVESGEDSVEETEADEEEEPVEPGEEEADAAVGEELGDKEGATPAAKEGESLEGQGGEIAASVGEVVCDMEPTTSEEANPAAVVGDELISDTDADTVAADEEEEGDEIAAEEVEEVRGHERHRGEGHSGSSGGVGRGFVDRGGHEPHGDRGADPFNRQGRGRGNTGRGGGGGGGARSSLGHPGRRGGGRHGGAAAVPETREVGRDAANGQAVLRNDSGPKFLQAHLAEELLFLVAILTLGRWCFGRSKKCTVSIIKNAF